MTELIKKYYGKYREQILYLIIGGCTTLVNWIVFLFFDNVCHIHYLLNNGIAWAAAVIFAFFPNRSLVFQNKDDKNILRQFFEFAASRVATLGIEELLMFLTVDLLGFSENLMKIAVSVVVVILNYVFSKIFVFRKK